MSTQSASGAHARREFWPWLGHNAWWLQMTIATVFAVSATWSVVTGEIIAHTAIPFAVGIGLFYWLSLIEKRHNRSLCEQCIAATPLDTQRAVDKHRRALQFAHRINPDGARNRQLLVIAAGLAVLALLLLVLPQRGSSLLALSVWVLGNVAAWSNEWHRRLHPWCPWCKRGRGWRDGGIPEPSPTPTRKVKA